MKIYESLLQVYLNEFYKFGEEALKAICNCSVPSKVVLEKYKTLPPIEQMPQNEKSELKKYVTEIFPEKTIEQKLDACKIIYTIGTLL